MNKLLSVALCLSLACVATLAGAHQLQVRDGPVLDGTLTGIRSAAVRIDGSYPQYRGYGLDTRRLQAALEDRLRQAGFQLLALDQAMGRADAVVLDLRLRITEGNYQFYSYSVTLTARQGLALGSQGRSRAPVSAWSDGRVGGIPPFNLGWLNGYAMGLLEHFLNDHRADNEKRL